MSQLLVPPSAHAINADFAPLIASIGEPHFGSGLVHFLHQVCGAEHTAAFYLTANELLGVTTSSICGADQNYQSMSIYLKEGLWRRDPSFAEAQAKLGVKDCATVHTDISGLRDDVLRNIVYGQRGIRDRVLICARSGEGVVVLTMCSSNLALSTTRNLEQIELISATLFSLLAKHIDVSRRGSDVSASLTLLEDIEACIKQQMPNMPRREAEVCSRSIYGVSSLGIALDLNISQETVITYRKRAYSRLGIATQRELFLWYLKLWSAWDGRPAQWGPAGRIGSATAVTYPKLN